MKSKTIERGPYLTYDEKIVIAYLYENNAKVVDIASHFGRDVSTIWRIAIDCKLKRKSIGEYIKEFEFKK